LWTKVKKREKTEMSLQAGNLHVGDEHSEVIVHDLSRTQLVQYAGTSGDYNPLHTDEPFAKEVGGYPTVFAHGMLTMGMTGKMLTNWVGDGRLKTFGLDFRSQVWPGDTLTATAIVTEIAEEDGDQVVKADVTTSNQNGQVVAIGYASAKID
tara:strand:+ start:1330 stop:1785 length:456 start_codon:yes stop_codon:yes gene_type:complete